MNHPGPRFASCFLVPCPTIRYFLPLQALAAMAAAGPHFSLKSWGPLFQAADVLGRAALLRDPKSDVWAGESAGGESYQSWAALEAVWEFAFLQARLGRLCEATQLMHYWLNSRCALRWHPHVTVATRCGDQI